MNTKQLIFTSFLLHSASGFAGNYFPLDIENNTKIASNKHVYIAIKANNNGKDCMMKIDHKGNAQCISVNKNTNLSDYNYSLATVPSKINLPHSSSGRIYFSIAEPIRLHVDGQTNKIVDPDGFNPRDPNYYTLYDKIEYTFNNSGTWMNPTAVDFFSLPIRINQPGASSSVTKAGYSSSRDQIINGFDNTLIKNDHTPTKEWAKLKLNYNGSLLRIIAPAKAMVNIPQVKPFPSDYLLGGKNSAYNYIDNLWQYYKSANIKVDCQELKSKIKLNNYMFVGKVEGDKFIFRNKDHSYSVIYPMEIKVNGLSSENYH